MIERQFDPFKIRTLTVDGGNEYGGITLASVCKAKGIQVKETTLYTPKQLGVSEIVNKLIVGRIRSTIID
jgi:IS30 family transposase